MSTASTIKLFSFIFFGGLAFFLGVTAFFGSAEVTKIAPSSSKWQLSKLDVIQMLKDRKYEVLTERYIALHAKFVSGDASSEDVSRAARAFDFADPTLHENFSEWVSKTPDSFAPYVARGIYLVRTAR